MELTLPDELAVRIERMIGRRLKPAAFRKLEPLEDFDVTEGRVKCCERLGGFFYTIIDKLHSLPRQGICGGSRQGFARGQSSRWAVPTLRLSLRFSTSSRLRCRIDLLKHADLSSNIFGSLVDNCDVDQEGPAQETLRYLTERHLEFQGLRGMAYHVPDEEQLSPTDLERLQRRKLAVLMREVSANNLFYRAKLGGVSFDPRSDPIDRLPFTTRAELQQDQADHPPYGRNLSYPLDRFSRFHQTSGSLGEPLRWLDTARDWRWLKRCWQIIFRAADLLPSDRVMFPFSFGPFIGFWMAFEAAGDLGNLVFPAGGMTTSARLRYLADNEITYVCCTPTYALRMAEVAQSEGIALGSLAVRALIVAGEPGGNIPATRKRIESAWGARVFDHCGMTEIGAWGFECTEAPGGLHVMENEFLAEVIDPETGQLVDEGELGELILTNLGRLGSPLIRYRSGDQVRLTRQRCACGRWFARAEGGVLGRLDDMLLIRGNNVFPSAVEGIIREFDEVVEFALTVDDSGSMARLHVRIEPAPDVDTNGIVQRVAVAIRDRLHLAADVELVGTGTLPRFEMKARRQY